MQLLWHNWLSFTVIPLIGGIFVSWVSIFGDVWIVCGYVGELCARDEGIFIVIFKMCGSIIMESS